MADMTLPFKLLSQPSPDTSGAIAADTRKLASGEALQRLKDSGAMDLQRRKGGDTLRNTAFQLGYGLTPEQAATGVYNPDQQAGLGRLQTAAEIGKFAPGLAALFRAGVGPKLTKDSTVQSLPTIGLKGTPFPGEAAANAAAQAEAKTVGKEKFWGTSPEERVGALSQYERSQERKSKVKGGAATQKLAANHIDYVTKNLGIPRDKIVGIVENPRVGNKEHQGTFVQYTDAKGKPRARRLSPQDIANMGAAQ